MPGRITRGRDDRQGGGKCREVMPPEGQHMKKVKDRKKRDKEKKPVQVKEDGRLDKAKISTIPSYTPGELPKR